MTTIVELVKKQEFFIDDLNIYFKVPQYFNAFCSITKVAIKESDCKTAHTAFENSDDLIPSQ